MKKCFALLIALLLLVGCAAAEELYAPEITAYRTDVTLEDFVGDWSLIIVRSQEPVHMYSYHHVAIHEDGMVNVSMGGYNWECFFDADAELREDGTIYLCDPEGGNGAYYFLFEDGLMGCAETLENPTTIKYLEYSELADWEEDDGAWLEEIAQEIWAVVGEVQPEASAEDFAGVWRVWSYEAGGRVVLDPDFYSIEVAFEDDKLRVTTTVDGDTDSYEVFVAYEENYAMATDEFGDEYQYFLLCSEDEMVLLDDPYLPTEVLFLYSQARWEAEEAAGAFDTGLDIGEQAYLTDAEAITGEWVATHIYFQGITQPVGDIIATLTIAPDGSATLDDGGYITEYTGTFEDGCLVVEDEEGYAYFITLHEGDVLIQTVDDDALPVSICFSRITEE